MSAAAQANASPQIASSETRGSKLKIILIAVVALSAMGGGFVWWHSHKTAVVSAQAVVTVQPPPTHDVSLEPLLVNLADDGGQAYLRVGMVLRMDDDAVGKKPANEKKADAKDAATGDVRLRDAALETLGRQQSVDLLASDGKEQLKTKLLNAIHARAPDAKVRAIYFTEFLVQR